MVCESCLRICKCTLSHLKSTANGMLLDMRLQQVTIVDGWSAWLLFFFLFYDFVLKLNLFLANHLAVFLPNQCLSLLPDRVCSCLAVKSIKKQHLVEVRSMANPPAAVKLALESICLLLGESTTDWKQIRSIIMRENFIPIIVTFSAGEIRWILASTQ